MLRKTPLVTVIPGTPEQPFRAASRTCVPVASDPGDIVPPPPTWGGYENEGITPPVGTAILLETSDGAGGAMFTEYVAPAPAGYVCRYETVLITDPTDPSRSTIVYPIVCTHPDLLP